MCASLSLIKVLFNIYFTCHIRDSCGLREKILSPRRGVLQRSILRGKIVTVQPNFLSSAHSTFYTDFNFRPSLSGNSGNTLFILETGEDILRNEKKNKTQP